MQPKAILQIMLQEQIKPLGGNYEKSNFERIKLRKL